MLKRIKRDIYTIHLKNGRELKFKAQNVDIDYNTVTGQCTRYNVINGKGALPMFLDVSEIVAVTIK